MAESRMGFLIDTSRCIACRSCQVACKQWNRLDADKTANQGSYENPRELTSNLYNRIRFVEKPDGGSMKWLFLNERCVHCGDAGCMKVCPSPGALYRTKEGFVAFNKEKCIACKYCVSACPFNIPRYGADEKVAKCNLCADRIEAGMMPACAKACPTQTLQYGPRGAMIAKAKASKKAIYGEADLSGLGVLYLLDDKPEVYGLPAGPAIPVSIFLWKDVVKPLGILGFWGSIAAVLFHYVTTGPKRLEEDAPEKGENRHE
ncbi:MAG: 4Fe-4S dicluster domain-containing protein [Deltaproteobacteria bacterium]|nr:4Fe-4S dicluster domain-containing protein [Candidatus Deferrimicrobiaceae bacterium]